MRPFVFLIGAMGVLAACAAPPSASGRADCGPTGGPVEAGIGGEAIMGVGSDGFISGTDLVFTTRVTPGRSSGCTTIGATIGG